ncbi:MAG: chloride channel protein [Kofleriaceae bacterium]
MAEPPPEPEELDSPAPSPPAPPWTFALGVVVVAIFAAGFAVAFRWGLSTALHLAAGVGDVVSAIATLPPLARWLSPALGGLLAGLLGLLVARKPSGHGVGDVMEAVVLGSVRLSMRVTLLKSAASWFAIVFGGSLGREGPLIQFGGSIGKVVSHWLRIPLTQARLLIAAGTAAGFAAAYNTPFAAVLFVLEVVTGMVVLDAILPALVATVIATAITRAVVGQGPIYGQRAFELESSAELLAFVGLAVFTALGAQAFMRLLSAGERAFQRRWLPLPWRPAVGALLAGLIIAAMPEIAGNGYEPINQLLDGKFTLGFVALLLLGKGLATTASVSSGSPGGVFTPILLVGGATGFLYAHGLAALGLSIGPPGGYVLVGMAGATAATTHAPLMAAVMIFELSGDYAIALPLVVAVAIATIISRRLRPDSIYTAELRRRGIHWEVTMDGRKVVR